MTPKASVTRAIARNNLYIHGAYREDRARWEEKLEGHCAKSSNDPEEDIWYTGEEDQEAQGRRGQKEEEGRKEEITVDFGSQMKGNMQPDKAHGAKGIAVKEMLKELLVVSISEVTNMFRCRFRGLVCIWCSCGS